MRSSVTRCALVVLPFFLLAGCRTTESGWHVPTWSLSSLNPFSSSSDEIPQPPRPSELAAPADTTSPGAGYAAATSSPTGADGYAGAASGFGTSPGSYPSTQQYPYSSASAGSPGGMGSAASASPAITPQNGPYAQPAGSGYSASAGSSLYGSSSGPGSAVADRGYQAGVPSAAYGSNAATTPRYDAVSDRYSLGASGSYQANASATAQGTAEPSNSVPSYATSQNTSSQSLDSRYQSAPNSASYSAADSRYSATRGTSSYASGGSSYLDTGSSDSRYGTGSQYGDNAGASASDPYTAVRSESTNAAGPGYNGYRNGDYQSTSGAADWNPGDTGYQPGQTGYEPGNTGYTPAGTSPYRSSVGSSYLPGSTKPYSPSQGGESTPEQSGSSTSPADSYVIPASHTRL